MNRNDFIALVIFPLAAGLLALSFIVVQSVADDLLRALCASLGSSHPLYSYLGCDALPPLPHSDEGG